jgi:uncharacterized protein YbjT (DUF2867 family)
MAQRVICQTSKGERHMRILIVGASKGIGLETTRQALASGYDVRALARSATSINLAAPKLEKVQGDALDKSDVDAAVAAVDAVIVTLGVGLGDLFKPVRLFSDATRVLIAAMKDKGVNRLFASQALERAIAKRASPPCKKFHSRLSLAALMTTKAFRKN